MALFSRRTSKENVGNLVLNFIRSQLPKGLIVTETLTTKDKPSITILSKSAAMSFELDFDNLEIDELSEIDKEHLINSIIIPVLKKIDQDLFVIHKEIEQKIKELKG